MACSYRNMCFQMMQSGLSWNTVFRKIPAFDDAFDEFDFTKVADYGDDKKAELLENTGIIRNRLKINAVINNAAIVKSMEEKKKGW